MRYSPGVVRQRVREATGDRLVSLVPAFRAARWGGGTMTAADSHEPANLLDGRYRLGECVGEGGMARVYRAEDVALGRTVAIKLIRPGVDGASSERARSEMTVLASLNHPSLVTLFDARLIPGQPEYLVMEFVDGPTLSSRLAERDPLPPDAVVISPLLGSIGVCAVVFCVWR